MSVPLLILVARSETRIQTYCEALELRGFACHPVHQLKELVPLTCRHLFHGILLDMPIMTKAPASEKALLEDIFKALPSAYLNIAPATDAIKLLTAGGNHGMAHSLDEFLAICRGFSPRLVRPNDRVPLHLTALLGRLGTDEPPEQTVTLNTSTQGCFLFSTNLAHQPEQQVQIVFAGLTDQTPIIATIRWVRPWGAYHNTPGIGVTFEQLSASQSHQLEELMAPFRSD